MNLNNILKYLIGAIIICILIIIVLLWKGCGSSVTPTAPPTVNPTLIKDSAILQDTKSNAINKKLSDSIIYLNSIIFSQQGNLQKLDSQKRILESSIRTVIKTGCPDIIDFVNLSDKRDTLCNGIVANQKIQLSIKDSIIKNDVDLYDSVYKRFNFLANQSTAQKNYIDSLQPKNEVYFGGGLYGNKNSIFQGADVGIFLKTKTTDRVYKFDVIYDFSKGIQYGISTYFKIHL